jgi:hypothetical protein
MLVSRLAGRFEDARRMLSSVSWPQAQPAAAHLLEMADNPNSLEDRIRLMVNEESVHFGLQPLAS